MEWNYEIENCPLNIRVCLLSANDCPLLPQQKADKG